MIGARFPGAVPHRLRLLACGLALGLACGLAGCGGGGGGDDSGGGSPPLPPVVGGNQLTVTIEQNPAVSASDPGSSTMNIPYVTVTVCNLSAQCVDVDHVVLDTGSYGLRILQSALNGLSLPGDSAAGGTRLAECAAFLDGYVWGGVSHATLQLGDETTSSLPLQVIGATGLPGAPASCSSAGPDIGSLEGLGGNGLLGVGQFIADEGDYYGCSSSRCTELSPQPDEDAQVSNPVAFLNSGDDNGVLMQMPAISASGAGTTYGVLSLGVGTQTDNAVTGFAAIPADSGGNLTVTLQGTPYPGSFIDSGSNFYFTPLSGVPVDADGNYIPPSLLELPVTLASSVGTSPAASTDAQIDVADYDTLDFSDDVAFNDIAAQGGSVVDLGMPFFYGRRIAYVIDGRSSPLGSGPLYAIH